MGVFDFLGKVFDFLGKNEQSPPKAVKRVFDVMLREEEGRKLTDEAISYRNICNFDKAFEILLRAVEEFDYKPAVVLIGTTAIIKGDIDGALRWFKVQIKERGDAKDFPLIELYANVGSIYNNRGDYTRALKMYAKALKSPHLGMYNDDDYKHVKGNVYHDIALVYSTLGDTTRARRYAEGHRRVRTECPGCKVIRERLERAPQAVSDGEHQQLASQPNIVDIRDAAGKTWGQVQFTDGKVVMTPSNEDGFITAMLQLGVARAREGLSAGDRRCCGSWADLPEHEWNARH